MPDVGAWIAIWCDTCQAIQPLRVDVIPAGDAPKDHAYADLMCTVCDSIVATLHQPDREVTQRP